jgi:hypothetical protein
MVACSVHHIRRCSTHSFQRNGNGAQRRRKITNIMETATDDISESCPGNLSYRVRNQRTREQLPGDTEGGVGGGDHAKFMDDKITKETINL